MSAVLRQEKPSTKNVVALDPFKCRMWELHDRIDSYINENTCRAEIESFAKYGQLVPVLGRPLKHDPSHVTELIYGARRLFVAQHLGRPLLVELREINDAEGIVAMDIENRHRRDISPYERGVSYLRWLRAGYFQSQEDVARAIQVSPSQVSRLIKLAQLPAVVVAAFQNPVDIRETWALDLAAALDDPQRRSYVCEKARMISSLVSRPPPREVFRHLVLSALGAPKLSTKPRDDVVVGRDGKPLFRIRQQLSTVAILLPAARVSAIRLEQIRALVSAALDEHPPEIGHSNRPSKRSASTPRPAGSTYSRAEDSRQEPVAARCPE